MADPRQGRKQVPNWDDPARPRTPGIRRRTVAGRIVLALVALVLFGLVSLTAVVAVGYNTTTMPDANADFQTATTTVYYDNGKTELGNFAVQNRQPLGYDEMPQSIKDAVVSAENRDFWTDRGISIRGLFRAGWVILNGGSIQGGSTITQQYIKIMYLNSSQTLTRKFRELFLAYKINKEMSKEEILAGYLNTIYFGRGAYGIQAASQAYFGEDAKKLTVPQAAVLAAVLNNPSLFDPADKDNLPRLQGRYQYVLQSMVETGTLPAARAATYTKALPAFPKIKTSDRYGGPKGFLLKMVERELAAAGFDPNEVSGGGLQVTTTFDKKDQDAAVDAAQKYTKQAAGARGKKASDLHAAVASVEVGTGEVLALYGGPDFVEDSRNWATTPRPTASTFKTYALAAGLQDEYSLRSTFNGNTFTPPGDSSDVRNEFSYQYGPAVTLLKAATDSINTAFVDLTGSMTNGPQKVADVAEAAGAPKGAGWDLNSRIALGTAEVSPLNQASAYATFGNGGTYVAPHVIKEVKDADGKVVYKSEPKENKAVSSGVAKDVTFALSNVVEQGTGRTVQTLNRPVAGKTGTKDVEDDIVSAWFIGYTPQVSTAVMYVAGADGNGDLDGFARPGDQTFFGGTYPALTWGEYMQTAMADLPVKQFDQPAYVNGDQYPSVAPSRTPQPAPTDEPTEEPTPTREPTTKASRTPSPTPTTRTPSSSPSRGSNQGGAPTPRRNG